MHTHDELRIEPAPEILDAARRWLAPVRTALGTEFAAAYLTGSVLTQGFDPRHSHVNVLIVARALDTGLLDSLARAVPRPGKPRLDPLFVSLRQIERSLDVFPIEWLEVQERHLRIEGDDVFAALEVPRAALRRQCEHELRGKHLRLRQAYVLSHDHPDTLTSTLRTAASGLAALFRTLLRLRGETPPADAPRVIERVADLYRLEAQALLGPHVLRYSHRRPKREEIQTLYRKFLVELDRLIAAVDELRVP
ncbi:MAG: hypothetical protein HYR73_04205 [Candidatus Eisenbacteria bacterium]|nr:hypothetical protein [Candidatus Eisenbacteria bacterium]